MQLCGWRGRCALATRGRSWATMPSRRQMRRSGHQEGQWAMPRHPRVGRVASGACGLCAIAERRCPRRRSRQVGTCSAWHICHRRPRGGHAASRCGSQAPHMATLAQSYPRPRQRVHAHRANAAGTCAGAAPSGALRSLGGDAGATVTLVGSRIDRWCRRNGGCGRCRCHYQGRARLGEVTNECTGRFQERCCHSISVAGTQQHGRCAHQECPHIVMLATAVAVGWCAPTRRPGRGR